MANLGNIVQGMAGIQSGYEAQKLKELAMQQVMRQEAAKQAFGRSLPAMFSPQSPQSMQLPGMQPMPMISNNGPQPPMPGQRSMPMRQPMMGNPNVPPQQFNAPMNNQPFQPQQPQINKEQKLTWQGIIQSVKQVAPNIDGATLAEVVNQYTPLMEAQSKAEWKEVQNQLKMEALEQRERQNQAMDAIRQQLVDVQNRRADIYNQNSNTNQDSLNERRRHNQATEENQANKATKEKPLTGPQQKRLEAITNTMSQTAELIDLISKYPNAVGTAGNLSRRRTGVTSILGRGLSDEEQAAQRIQELNKELQNGLPTVEKYATVGGGKASDFSNLDVANWTQGAGALLPRLQQLQNNLSNVQQTFYKTTGRKPITNTTQQSDGDYSDLWQ